MILAIDIGGTKIAAALVADGVIVDRRSCASTLHGDYGSIPDIIADMCAPWSGRFHAVGIASAGLVEGRQVRFVSRAGSPVIHLADAIQHRFGIEPRILNDAWAGALGEFSFGTFGAADTVIYVTVSTGIGAGIVHRGRLLTSRNGLMAHLGHMTARNVGGEPVPCPCGRTDCLETFASGTAIETRAAALQGAAVSAREVFAQEHFNSAFATLLDEAAATLAQALVDARALLGADCFVLGGSIGLTPAYFSRVLNQLEAQPHPWRPDLRMASLGKDAELYGAAIAAAQLNSQLPL